MGTGSIERLKSGAFRVAVYAGKDPITCRKVYLKETHPTEGQAISARDRLLAQIEAENHPDRAATVSVLLDRWVEVVDHELSTAETTAGYIRRTIKPAIGEMQLRKLQHRVDVLDRLYTHLRRCNVLCDGRRFVDHTRRDQHDCAAAGCQPHRCKPMAPATVRRIHSILSGALGYAVSWGWIERNPAEHAHPPKLARRRAKPPGPEQVARLLNVAWQTDIELAMFLWLATTTGARRGELCALRWSVVDLVQALLLIDSNYVVRSGERRLKATKTDSDRRLAIDPLTVQMLTDFRRHREEQLAPAGVRLAKDAFVFTPDPAGLRPWHPDHFTHAYRKLANTLAITEPLKNLRHFNATQLLAAGVDLRTTAGRLGHTDGGATTLRVYADWMPAVDRHAASQLSDDLARLGAADGNSSLATRTTSMVRASRPISEVLVDRPVGRVTYVDITRSIHAAITAGRLGATDLVPTVTELASWFRVARSTAQRAISTVAASGAIIRTGSRWTVARS
jgi:integrase